MNRPVPDQTIEPITLNLVNGGEVTFGAPQDRWSMLIVYRGKHCPRCKRFLGKFQSLYSEFSSLLDVTVVSADALEKAKADLDEHKWSFPLAYGLSEDQMRGLGVYITDPLTPTEADGRFSEPGMFAIRPDGRLMLVDISNGPAARPDLDELLDGLRFNIEKDRPARGLVE